MTKEEITEANIMEKEEAEWVKLCLKMMGPGTAQPIQRRVTN
jgi:hypothetical protein